MSVALPIALCSAHVEVAVSRGVALHHLTQRYKNNNAVPVTARYLFPLQDGSAICGFKATFASGRTIQGRVEDLHQARRDFDEAVQAGAQAALLEERRPDVFETLIGNIGPGEELIVALEYCCELMVEQDALKLAIPVHVAPRYAPRDSPDSMSAHNSDSVSAINHGGLLVEISWQTGSRGPAQVVSPTHPDLVQVPEVALHDVLGDSLDRSSLFRTRLESDMLDRDVVLVMQPDNLFEPVVMWEEWDKHGTQAMMLSLVPKFEVPQVTEPEVVFIVDCSGSMAQRIQQTREALETCIKSLPHDAYFNVIRFGTNFAVLWADGARNTNESKHEALAGIHQLQANMGGTELLQPLNFALRDHAEPTQQRSKQIILLTDGQVTNEQFIIDSVRGRGCRIFSIGIGSGVSTFLVQGLARATSGYAAFVKDGESLQPICEAMLKKALTPSITDLRLTWPSAQEDGFVVLESPLRHEHTWNAEASVSICTEESLSFFDPCQTHPAAYKPPQRPAGAVLDGARVQQAPQRPPALFADSHFCAFVLYPQCADPAGKVEIAGQTSIGPISLQVPLPPTPTKRHSPLLHRMAARALIRDIEEGDAVESRSSSDEARRLSKAFSVLCQTTAFVAVDCSSDLGSCFVLAPQRHEPQRRTSFAPVASPYADTPVATFQTALSQRHRVRAPTCVTNAVSWRSEGIVHKKNEIFLDATERLRCLIGGDNSVLQCQIHGTFKIRCYLSGMPEVRLTFNERFYEIIEDATFHQCVRLDRFCDGCISFLPPDGEFELLCYSVSNFKKPPLMITTVIGPGRFNDEAEYSFHAKSLFGTGLEARSVEVLMPVPDRMVCLHFSSSAGSVDYDSEKQQLVWQMKGLRGMQEEVLTATMKLPARKTLQLDCKDPVLEVSCEVSSFLASGLQVRSVKVIEKTGYQALQRVQCRTQVVGASFRLPPR